MKQRLSNDEIVDRRIVDNFTESEEYVSKEEIDARRDKQMIDEWLSKNKPTVAKEPKGTPLTGLKMGGHSSEIRYS